MALLVDSNQLTAANTAAILVGANENRVSLRIKNTHATVACFFGGANVTATNGDQLSAGDSVLLVGLAAAAGYSFCDTGATHPVVSYSEVIQV